jgi:urea transport system permease protein
MKTKSLLDRQAVIVLSLLGLAAVLVPVLNVMTAPGSALHVSDHLVPLLGKYLSFALLALSVDLIWGFCGILSLGHGAFFALGGYAMGMYLMRQIGPRGVYADPILPDFMVFLNWKELPWFWYGFDWFPYAAVMVLLVPGALAFVFGWFAFRSRVTGVYLSIITQAMTFALMLAFFRNDMGFGGNNGLTDFKEILGFPLQSASTRIVLFVLSAVALAAGYILAVFTVSAMLAGLAGALYVPQVGIINPGEFAPANSIEVVIWVAVGGRGTLAGAILGALVVNAGKTWFTGALPEFWLFALGGLFVFVTLLMPRGILGTAQDAWTRARARLPSRSAPNALPHAAE